MLKLKEEAEARKLQKLKDNAMDRDAVYLQSVERLDGISEVRGYNLNVGIDYEMLFKSYINTGFQATNLGLGIQIVNKMI